MSRPVPPEARRRWLACRELSSLLSAVEPNWSPAENYYYPLPSEPLTPADIAGRWRQALGAAARGGQAMTSLYVHIPFCPSKCLYCVYCSKGGASSAEIAAYLQRLHAEIDFYAPAFAGASFDAWSIGGGTPTILSPEALDALLTRLRRAFPPKEGASLEFETSPYTASPERSDVFQKHGFNRVSFGVQSFSHGVLSRVGRGYQKREHVRRCVDILRSRGFRINMDLLYGLPGSGLAETRASAQAAMALGPDSIVIYPLAAGTPALDAPGVNGAAVPPPLGTGSGLPPARTGAAVPFEDLAPKLAALADKMGYAVESDWFSARLHSRKLLRPSRAPAAYDDLHAGPLLMMCLGPTSRGHIHGRMAYRHDAYDPGAPFQAESPVARGWILGLKDEMRMHLTRSLSRKGRIDSAEFQRLFGERLRASFGRDLDALTRLGALSAGADGFDRSRKPGLGHAPELYLLGDKVCRRLSGRGRVLGAAGIINAGIRLHAAGRRASAAARFKKAASIDPAGVGGAVWKAARSSPSFHSLWNAVKVHAEDSRVDLGPLEAVLGKVRKLLDQGIRLFAANRKSSGAKLFEKASTLDPGGAGTVLLAVCRGSRSMESLSEAASGLGEGLADLGPLERTLARIRLLNREGVRLFHDGERGRSRRLFQASLKLDPDDHNSLMSLGALACSEGRPGEALSLYDRAGRAPLAKDALADWAGARALALEKLGRAAEARSQVTAVLEAQGLSPAKRQELAAYRERLSRTT